MTASLRQAAGSLLVVGLAGTELTSLERAWLKLMRPAGIILFGATLRMHPRRVSCWTRPLDLCAAHSVRCVDVEGGTVDRLRDALAPMPSAQAVMRAAVAAAVHGLSSLGAHGELVARAVKAFGFNTTLAPVAGPGAAGIG